MKKSIALLTVMVMTLMGTLAQAETITLGSAADTYLRDSTVRGTFSFMDVRGGSIDFAGYLRFDLSALGAVEITGAQLILTVSGGASRNDYATKDRFALYGLNNVAGNTAQNWDEAVLMDTNAGQEWNSSMPMTTALTNGWITDLDDNVPGITEVTPNSGSGGALITVSGTPLDAFLQSRANDNGLVTFILANDDGTDRGFGIATKEHTTTTWHPQLVLTYTPIRHAYNPIPEDEALINVTDNLSKLSWTNPDPNNPGDIITANVYFGTNEPNELFADYGITRIYTEITDTEVNIPAGWLPLDPATEYWWVVDCYDPNEGLLPGPFWSFFVSGTPQIVTDPTGTAIFETETAEFSAVFTSDAAISSGWPKWFKEGDPDVEVLDADPDITIGTVYDSQTGQYTSTLTIAAVEAADEGHYYCEISNANGVAQTLSGKLLVKRQLAYWPFDGDPNDVMDTYDGTPTGNPVYDAGKVGQAIVFDGLDDVISLPAGFDDFTAGMTVSLWAYPTNATSYSRFIDFGNGESIQNIALYRVSTSDELRFNTLNGSVSAAGALALDTWQMFVVTMDEAGNVVIYKDGLPIQTGTVGLPDVVTRTSNFIGESNWSADALYTGMLDEMRIYNYGLSADNVADLYAAIVGEFCRYKPVYDMSGDCRVTITDLAMFADYWLDSGFYPGN